MALRTVKSERGAAMIEMALMLPLLLLVLTGLIDFGRLFMAEIMVTNAAREGARMYSMGYSTADSTSRITAALPGMGSYGGVSSPVYGPACPDPVLLASQVSVKVSTANFKWIAVNNIAGLFGGTIPTPQPNSTAVMRCVG